MQSTDRIKTGVICICLCANISDAIGQKVGIDIANPLFKLDVRNGSINTDSLYRIGTKVVLSVKGTGNLFMGKNSGISNLGSYNTFSGDSSGYANFTGHYNSFFGRNAGKLNDAASNSFFGAKSGENTTTGYFNSFFGRSSGVSNTAGHSNAFFGSPSGSDNTTGYYNSFFGAGSGDMNTEGYENAFYGKSSGFANTIGYDNACFGTLAGSGNISGTFNTLLGYNADVNTGSLTNASSLGANAQVDCSNCLVLGSVNGVNGATASVKVGIGITNPLFKLDVRNGSINTDSVYRIGTYTVLSVNGINNLFVGTLAGKNTTGGFNTFGGYLSGLNNTIGTNNTFFGEFSGVGNTIGNFNVAVGHSALSYNDSGSYITAIGQDAEVNAGNLLNATVIGAKGRVDCSNCMVLGSINGLNGATSNVNVGLGTANPLFRLDVRNGSINTDSVYRIGTFTILSTKGIGNTFLGREAGRVNTGIYNAFVGNQSGYNNMDGNYNAFFGDFSGQQNSSGDQNVSIGSGSLTTNTTGSNNTGLGYNAEVSVGNLTNATAIGANARVDCSDCMVLGSVNGINGGTANVKVGIGNNNPTLPLSFGLGLGDKISLYGSSGSHYGFGIQSGLLQIHTAVMASDIAFGYGNSDSFNERMRIKGTGNVGIGITNPIFKLDVRNGSINTDSLYRIGTIPVLAVPGTGNLFVGKNAGKITTGNNNAFGGSFAGFSNTTGFNNAFFGESAGWGNNTGHDNVFIGQTAGWNNQTGNFNSFIGRLAGFANTGDNNTALGYQALNTNGTGADNTAIGYNSDVNTSGLSNATAVGANARADCSDCMVLGSVNGINGGTANVKVGIGHNSPAYPLTFAHSTGDKISLYGDGSSSYGFGITDNLLQMHSYGASTDIAFGYGNSGSFTEAVRIKGNGRVGIGTNAPGYILDVNGRMRIRSGGTDGTSAGLWLNNNANSSPLAFIGMENDSYAGMYCAAGFQFKMNVTNGNVAIGSGDATDKLTVHGNVRANGNICYIGTIGACSDIRYKTNLSPLKNSLDKVKQIQGLYYFWKQGEFETRNFNDQRQIGFSAQEIETLFPEIVQTDADGYKAVDYGRLTPVLVEAIKEQQLQIADQQKQIDELRALVNDLRN